MVWQYLGDVDNFVEPFANSAAVLLARPHAGRVETLNDWDCVAPATKILKADLRWAQASEIRVGDKLMGFDESNGPAREGLRAPTRYRRWCEATVTGIRRIKKPCYRLTFDDGTTVVCSFDHQWLGGSHATGGRGWRWQTTEGLVCNRKTQRSWVCKVCDVVEPEESYEAGWLAGFYDGEGNFTSGSGWRISVTQGLGEELDRAVKLMRERGFETRQSRVKPQAKAHHRRVATFQFNGGMRESLRFLMSVRPERLIRNLRRSLTGKSLYGRSKQAVGLVSKEFLGEQDVVAIETDSHTFIAEGLASHNCYVANFWRATKHEPEAVAEHADNPVNEADLHARHRFLVLSEHAAEFRQRMRTDPEFYDAKFAGWWCWGACCWIGSGWCVEPQQMPHMSDAGRGINTPQQMQCLSTSGGQGVNATGPAEHSLWDGKRPRLHGGEGADPPGVHSGMVKLQRSEPRKGLDDTHRPQLADAFSRGRGVNGNDHAGTCAARLAWLTDWMMRLRDRLRTVRVCCGDWIRVCDSPSTTTRLGLTGIFLDPPYRTHLADGKSNRTKELYASDRDSDVNALVDRVIAYCLERGSDPQMRIAVCGYEGEGYEALEQVGWTVERWKASGGYGNQSGAVNENAGRERIWFSPHCVGRRKREPLFANLEGTP